MKCVSTMVHYEFRYVVHNLRYVLLFREKIKTIVIKKLQRHIVCF